MEPTFYADILFFAVIAGFIAYRLYSVLGRKDGTEQNITHRVKEMWEAKAAPKDMSATPEQKNNVVALLPSPARAKRPMPEISHKNVADAAKAGVAAITEKDRTFTTEHFLAGAQSAYDIILTAFAEGNKPYLKTLLDPVLYGEFEGTIDNRFAAGETMSTSLVALVRAEIVAAKLENSVATITVAFESEQISFTKNSAGEVISGNPTVSERLYDKWVFERNLNNRNPVWLLTDTDATE
jgi:predicted lipid-binding transport protein (Tim44 family)